VSAPPLDQAVPLYSFEAFVLPEPPTANPAVSVPAPLGPYDAAGKAPPADQEVPLYS